MCPRENAAGRSLRFKLLVPFLVPLATSAALWVFAAGLAPGDSVGAYPAAYRTVTVPSRALTAALQRERAASALLLSTQAGADRRGLLAARAATDTARTAFHRSARSGPARGATGGAARTRLGDVLTRLGGLTAVRAQVDAGAASLPYIVGAYDAIIDALLGLPTDVIAADRHGVARRAAALASLATARDLALREDALVTATLAARDPRMSGQAYAVVAQSAYNERYLFDAARADLDPGSRAPFDRLARSREFTAFRVQENLAVAGRPGAPPLVRSGAWRGAVTPMTDAWGRALTRAGDALAAEARSIGDRNAAVRRAVTVLGLLTVLLSIFMPLLSGRRLVRELARLGRHARELADVRLPELIERIRGGATADDATPPGVPVPSELTDVAAAMSALGRAAADAAAGEARLREGINNVLVDLAWRKQSLLQRQLSMLDRMERQASDPDLLDDLLELDHLATRMCRHADGLVILSGAPATRNWQHPMALRDVLRGAIVAIDDHARVDIEAVSPVAFEGSVVADARHMLAELIENAAIFSPPDTEVRVSGRLTDTGYVVEVEDQGIGMDADELADANERLSAVRAFDPADGDRLGLLIVGRLAARHGVRVTLGPSPYGGTRAAVLIPPDLIVGDDGSGYDRTLTGGWTGDTGSAPGWGSFTGAAPGGPIPGVGGADPGPGPAAVVPSGGLGVAPSGRTPEETRALLSSLQRGWRRGREEPGAGGASDE